MSLPTKNASPPAAVHARILGDASVRLWGLSPRERLVRLLRRARVANVGDATEPVPGGCSMVLMRGDYVYDDRVVTALVRTPNVLLRVTGDDGPAIVAAHVPAALATRAREVMSGAASPTCRASSSPSRPRSPRLLRCSCASSSGPSYAGRNPSGAAS